METKCLVIFDYSGTLSVQATRFARTGHLERQLAECGLADFGIDRADIFWNEIVSPSWEEGSTTGKGYITLMAERIGKRMPRETGSTPSKKAIREAAALFVRRYLAYSTIDPDWAPLLKWLSASPDILTLIATDHYAEATNAIITHLKNWKLEGMALRNMMGKDRQTGNLIIANSADLGAHKADRAFWEILGTSLPLNRIHRVLFIDDFGAHEQTGDTYGVADRIALRRERTVKLLGSTFHLPIDVIDFTIHETRSSDMDQAAFSALIKHTIAGIMDFLKSEP